VNDFSKQQFNAFFAAISSWRSAYKMARLNFLALRSGDDLSIVAARVILYIGGNEPIKPHFSAGKLEAGQWEIPQDKMSVENVVEALINTEGLHIEGFGRLRLTRDEASEIFIAPPILLHPEGTINGNRIAVLAINGINSSSYVPQPESDWFVRAAKFPYDSVQELCIDYGLGAARADRAVIEVVAGTAVQVLARSAVQGESATIGIWMARNLDVAKTRLGFRILNKGNVVKRGSVSGLEMVWQDDDFATVGTIDLEIPAGALVQCIASYDGHAQHVQLRLDPSIFQNPRAALLNLVDPTLRALRGYLQPDLPPRGKVADDFETAIGWLLWALGFSTATFGTNAKTRDAFDTVAVAPSGDFVVVECTIGLLRAESKLSKVAARAASLREALAASNLKNLRVLPVIVTAMTSEQTRGDIAQAEEIGVLVLSREDLQSALETDLYRYPDADSFYERAIASVQEKRSARLKQPQIVSAPY
jgi:hypothetical protein